VILSDRLRRFIVRMSVFGLIFSIQYAELHDSYGSVAALRANISSTAASGGKAAPQRTDFQNRILNVCFSRKRSFTLKKIRENEGLLSAISGH